MRGTDATAGMGQAFVIAELERELAVWLEQLRESSGRAVWDAGSMQQPWMGHVLSVHTSTLNLEFPGRLVTVTGRGTEQACDEILLEEAVDFTRWGVLPGESVTVEAEGIRGEHFFLEEREPEVFRLPEPRLKVDGGADPVEIDGWIYKNGKPSALWYGYFGLEDDSVLGRFFGEAFGSLNDQISRMTQEELLEAAMKLCGAGVGLTPSADDFLTGLLLLLSLCFPEHRPLYRRYARGAFGRTVKLSAYMMENAASGRGRISELRLLEAMFSGNGAKTERELERVADFGSTSGTDTLIGIAFGMKYLAASQELSKRTQIKRTQIKKRKEA